MMRIAAIITVLLLISCGAEQKRTGVRSVSEEHGAYEEHEAHEEHRTTEESEEHHGEACDHDEEHAGGAHREHHAHPELQRSELGVARCEHDMETVGCDECRYELGLVKVDEEIDTALVQEVVVKQDKAPERQLELRCEVGVNRLASTDVVALRKGRVLQMRKGLGEPVRVGEVMAVLESDAFGEAARRHQEAHLSKELAEAKLKRLETIQKNLSSLVVSLKESGETPMDPARVAAMPVGERKAELMSAASDYWKALAEWEIVEKRLTDGQALLDHLEGRKKVKLGELEVGDWKSRALATRAQVRFARKAVNRARPLVDKGVSSRSELDGYERDLAAASAAYTGAIEMIAWEMQQARVGAEAEVRRTRFTMQARLEQVGFDLEVERLSARRSLEDARARMEVEHRTLVLFGYGPEEVDSVNLLAPERFGKMEIRSPVRGMVVGVFISPGAMAAEGARLFTVTDPTRHWVWCDVHRGDLADLLKGGPRLPTLVTSKAWPDHSFEGQLDYLDWKADPLTRTVRARVVLDDPGRRLRPGLFVRALVNLSVRVEGLWVPRSAVVDSGEETFVFVRWRDSYWLKRTVEVEETAGERVRLRGDVNPGDRVATKGAFFLKSDVMRESMGAGCAH